MHSYLATFAPFFALAACVLSALGLFFVIMVSRRVEQISAGPSGSLEKTLEKLSRDVAELQVFRADLEQYLKHAEGRLRTSVRGVGVVRYNPFANDGSSGGNQSFAIAFLDESQSGVVFSALYSRDRVGVYAKPLEAGRALFKLSEEEEYAVAKAKESMSEKKRDVSAK